jgi:rRNA-processing protein FCF1
MIIQGPPGTGKTHLMAGLVAQLIQNNKSVLVTAMTNRALIELAEKDSLKDALAQKKVKKTNVSSDEIIACKNLCPVDSKQITCMPGCVTLSTFYNSSGWAKTCYEERPFDYVIMDEASQALFGMIAASMNLGKKIIWIGDQNQMQPIVLLSEETLVRNDYYMLANGFQTLCDNFSFPSFILTESHRLLPNAAALTSSFYHTPIKSVADFDYIIDSNKFPFAPKDGGCTILYKEMPVGEKADRHSCLYAIDIITKLLSIYPDIKVAVLSKFRATVRMLQNCFISQHGSKNNVLIDTVERVQGMTCDVCLYFIPNTMTNMSLDKALFNVATSRAKQLTIIVADKSIAHNVCDKDVNMFMQKIITGNIEQLTSKGNDTEDNSSELHSGLKVVGKIDLSQFETPKQKAVKSQIKKNIYIIDTNVFVNCPNIISKLDEKYLVVLSAKVIDELDKLKIKLSNEDKKNVETALRCINRALDKPNVKMELSDLSLLPNDFDKRSPDNNILTVALKFKDENPILLTSDNGLQVKAKGLNIKTISLKDFLKK